MPRMRVDPETYVSARLLHTPRCIAAATLIGADGFESLSRQTELHAKPSQRQSCHSPKHISCTDDQRVGVSKFGMPEDGQLTRLEEKPRAL